MRIYKNTTPYESKVLKAVLFRIHNHMKKLEGRPAPNWSKLRIDIGTNNRGYSGWAYYLGRGPRNKWDVRLSIPPNATEHGLGRLAYHEFMHTYGYRHNQYGEIPASELLALFPDNKPLGPPVLKKAKPAIEYGVFPIKIKMTSRTLEELVHSESGSLEDWENEDRDPKDHPHGHPAEIAGRHKTVLEIRSQGELDEMIASVNWSTFSLHCPAACERLAVELDNHDEETP